ncbi:MAG TPA: Uma2 family endonuclease [Acidobacteriota bacterium]|nr:Uma2 family endonuclease [Acidobacteriota bacterium]
MAAVLPKPELWPVVLRFDPVIQMTEGQFFDFCQQNDDWQIERTAQGEIEIMPPTGGITSRRNFLLGHLFAKWEEETGTGLCFDSNCGFTLPNGADRSPDIAWVANERWEKLTETEQEHFVPLCPDFVLELRSPTDNLSRLQQKMEEYIENGARLGWLIDPKNKRVYVYQPDQSVQTLENPSALSGEPVLRGFTLDLAQIWPSKPRIKNSK